MEYQGASHDPGGRFAIVVSRWNEYVTQGLLQGALKTFSELPIDQERIDIAWVPGALEIPLISQQMLTQQKYRALLALGCVVKGETAHFDVVVQESCRHLTDLSRQTQIPVLLGILTTYNLDQAIARSSPDENNKGSECARAAVEMVTLLDSLSATK